VVSYVREIDKCMPIPKYFLKSADEFKGFKCAYVEDLPVKGNIFNNTLKLVVNSIHFYSEIPVF
jgi:hypothetical protein